MLLLFACASDTIDVDRPPETEPTEEPEGVEGTEDVGGPGEEPVEEIVGPGEPGDEVLFDEDVVHRFDILLDGQAVAALNADPRSYAEGTLVFADQELVVGVKLKGNSTFQYLSSKPALKIKVDHVVDGQRFLDSESFNLHNQWYNPSMMGEQLAYAFFRDQGLPAPRTGNAVVSINGEEKGLYSIVEQKNERFLELWWEDDSGSLYEVGSFNHGCDLDSGSTVCFEVDREGTGDSQIDLDDFLRAMRDGVEGETWTESLDRLVGLQPFLQAQAAEIVVAHYDNYGWNVNNWHIYHVPSDGIWGFSPWSTDLAWGWYPWVGSPTCGTYGQHPTEYGNGYLMERCFGDALCRATLLDALDDQADALEAWGLSERIDARYDLIVDHVYADTWKAYDNSWFEQEVACIRAWGAQRPAQIRGYVDALRGN